MMRKQIDVVNHEDRSEPSAEDVFEALHSAMHLYRSEQLRNLRDSDGDLTHMDLKVLGFFSRHPGSTSKDLADHSGRDKGQLARLIGGLRARGLLEASPDLVDRRNVKLRLTDEGRSIQRALQRRSRKVSELAVAALDAKERREIVSLLGKVMASLRRVPG